MSIFKAFMICFMHLILAVLPDWGHRNEVSEVLVQKSALNKKIDLLGFWIHSQEEDYDGIRVYRLSGYEFPPARGREKMNLMKNGVLEYTPIAPNDRHVAFQGTWTIQGSELVLEYGDKKRRTYRIEEREGALLKLKN